MTINFNNNKAYSGVSGAYSGKRRPGGGSSGGCVAATGSDLDVGTGGTNVQRYPVYGYYKYGITMTILRQSDIGAGEKRITDLSWKVATSWSAGYTFPSQTLKIAHIPNTQNQVPNNTWRVDLSNIPSMTDLTTVKNNFTWDAGSHSSGDWAQIDFDDFFCYNGTDNILVIWENRKGAWSSGFGSVKATVESSSADFRAAKFFQDASYPSASTVLSYDNIIPNIKVGY